MAHAVRHVPRGLESIAGGIDPNTLTDTTLFALPYHSYVIPMLVAAIAIAVITFMAIVVALVKIGLWSKNGEKQELLKQDGSDR